MITRHVLVFIWFISLFNLRTAIGTAKEQTSKDGTTTEWSSDLLKTIANEYPDLLRISPEEFARFITTDISARKEETQRQAQTQDQDRDQEDRNHRPLTKFVGMPAGSGRQRGSCDKILKAETGARWIHGATSLQDGAMTLLFFMSQQCVSCHDVAVKLNKVYAEWRHRGLNVCESSLFTTA
jgi:hypothetical protein